MSNNQGAQINIKALAEFGRTLMKFSNKLDESNSVMENSLKQLGNEWKDDKYNEFQQSFIQHINALKPLSENLKRYNEHFQKEWIPIIEVILKKQMGV